MDLRKSPNLIRTSVGQPVLPWTIFGQAVIAISRAYAVFDLYAYGAQFSELYYRVRFSLHTSDREHKVRTT